MTLYSFSLGTIYPLVLYTTVKRGRPRSVKTSVSLSLKSSVSTDRHAHTHIPTLWMFVMTCSLPLIFLLKENKNNFARWDTHRTATVVCFNLWLLLFYTSWNGIFDCQPPPPFQSFIFPFHCKCSKIIAIHWTCCLSKHYLDLCILKVYKISSHLKSVNITFVQKMSVFLCEEHYFMMGRVKCFIFLSLCFLFFLMSEICKSTSA